MEMQAQRDALREAARFALEYLEIPAEHDDAMNRKAKRLLCAALEAKP